MDIYSTDQAGYVITCIGNCTEEKFSVNMFEFPSGSMMKTEFSM
jgi:hypothetical protein